MARNRAYRRHQTFRARNRARRTLRAQKNFEPSVYEVVRLAIDRKPCSCCLCSFREESPHISMRKAEITAVEQLDEVGG